MGRRTLDGLAGLAKNPFSRFVLRAILGLAVIGLWPLLRGCGMWSQREMGLMSRLDRVSPYREGLRSRHEVGTTRRSTTRCAGVSPYREGWMAGGGPTRNLAAGFAVGFGSLAGAAGLAIVLRRTGAQPVAQRAGVGGTFCSARTVSAMVVAMLEELIFRGALFGILRKAWQWPVALAVSSAVYAAVHFLQRAGGAAVR